MLRSRHSWPPLQPLSLWLGMGVDSSARSQKFWQWRELPGPNAKNSTLPVWFLTDKHYDPLPCPSAEMSMSPNQAIPCHYLLSSGDGHRPECQGPSTCCCMLSNHLEKRCYLSLGQHFVITQPCQPVNYSYLLDGIRSVHWCVTGPILQTANGESPFSSGQVQW